MLVLLILYGAHCFVGVYGLKKLVNDDITVAFASYDATRFTVSASCGLSFKIVAIGSTNVRRSSGSSVAMYLYTQFFKYSNIVCVKVNVD